MPVHRLVLLCPVSSMKTLLYKGQRPPQMKEANSHTNSTRHHGPTTRSKQEAKSVSGPSARLQCNAKVCLFKDEGDGSAGKPSSHLPQQALHIVFGHGWASNPFMTSNAQDSNKRPTA